MTQYHVALAILIILCTVLCVICVLLLKERDTSETLKDEAYLSESSGNYYIDLDGGIRLIIYPDNKIGWYRPDGEPTEPTLEVRKSKSKGGGSK